MPAKMEWRTIFFPEFDSGGLSLTRDQVSLKVFENAESPATTATLSAAWLGSNVTVTRETTAPLAGEGSIKVVVSGGAGDIIHALDRAKFGYPFPGHNGIRFRYIKFRGTTDSGTETIRVTLQDASDANHYRYWDIDVAQSKYTEHVVDLDPDNEESNPTFAAEGSTTWDPELIDEIGFTNLSNGRTFYIDDLELLYEYSLTDIIGFPTEAPVSMGDVGSLHSRINGLWANVKALEGQTQQYAKQGIAVGEIGQALQWAIELNSDFAPPDTTEIIPGNYTIDRVRAAATTSIVGSSTASESAGTIYASYTITEADWDTGDLAKVTFSGGYIRTDEEPTELLTATVTAGGTTVTVDNAYQWQVGWLVRIYDDDSGSEWHTIASIDTPTTFTIDATTAEFTVAQNGGITRAIRTDLSTAVFFTMIQEEAASYKILARGTLTTSSATVPADTARTEADNFWNGCWLMTVAGAITDQPRLIVDFANTGGIFTLDTEHPFTAVPGTVEYVILGSQGLLVPATDGTNSNTVMDVVGDKTDTADYTFDVTTSSAIRLIKGILGSRVVEEGTFTTSSATVPADTGLGAYATNYFNGCYLIPIAGDVLFQPRRIVGFTTTSGIFTMDTDHPFTAATGTVAYIIVASDGGLIPGTDSTADQTVEQAVGAKADTADYTHDVVTSSVIRLIKGILGSRVIEEGTFTTSSATIPADTGIGAYATNYFNGSYLIPLTGDVAFQPRRIITFTTTTGVFTMDTDHPFTAATGSVAYIIVAADGGLIPGTDSTADQTVEQAVGAKADTADYTYDVVTSSVMRLVKGILGSRVIGEGTFTTGSATIPADTGQGAKASDWFNGQILIPLTGDVAFQPRLIADFTTTSGVFTMDADHPFTAATGTVAYIIVANDGALVTGVDSTNNLTMMDVLGNKSDTADITSGSASLMRIIRGILAALGIVPAAGTGFEIDGTGTNLYEAIAGVTEAVFLDGTAQQSLADMPYVKANLEVVSSPQVDSDSIESVRLSLHNLRPGADVIQTTEYSGTTVTIQRYRIGSDTDWTNVVTTQAMTEAAGYAYYPYTFPAASWKDGDLVRYITASCAIEIPAASGQIYQIPSMTGYGVIGGSSAIMKKLNSLQKTTWMADWDEFDVADADADTERWNAGYLNGAAGGSADINTTTADKLMVKVVPGVGAAAAMYAAYEANPTPAKFATWIVDVDVTIVGSVASYSSAGIEISNSTYDTTNRLYVQRQKNNSAERIATGAIFNNVSQGEVVTSSITDTTVALRVERLDNTWRTYYSLSQSPNYEWVLIAQYEDPSEYIEPNAACFLQAYSPGTDGNDTQGDFDNWKKYIGNASVIQALVGDYDSSTVLPDIDGSVAERIEALQSAIGVTDATVLTGFEEDGSGANLFNSLIAVQGLTTGAGDTTTLADTGRTETNNYWIGSILLMLSGANAGLSRPVVDSVQNTSVIVYPAFPNATGNGSTYVLLGRNKVPVPATDATSNYWPEDVVGNKTDTASVAADTVSIVRLLRGMIAALNITPTGTGTGFEDDGASNLVTALGTDGVTVTDAATSVLGAIGADNANNAFDSSNVVQNDDGSVLEREEYIQVQLGYGVLEIEADAGSDADTIIDAAALTQATDDWWKGALLVSINGQNEGQARPVVTFSQAADSLEVYPAFLNVPDAGDDFLLISAWRPWVWNQQPDVAVTINAILASETDVFDLNDSISSYIVNSLRIKCADPGANTVSVRLYELINDISVNVQTFTIDTNNFGTYFSLMDMFGQQQLAGDDLQVTVQASAGGPYEILGQYHFAISKNG